MVRDAQESDVRWRNVSCATVHQFQGSEKPVIIYDAVDCYRMKYPGVLLSSLKNDTANRLFNVALTRAKGKFTLVANVDFMKRKKLSKKLLFAKTIAMIEKNGHSVDGGGVLDELMPRTDNANPLVYIEDRSTSWKAFIDDIKNAKKTVFIDVPDLIMDDSEKNDELADALGIIETNGVDIRIRTPENVVLPDKMQEFVYPNDYVANPVTLIDKKIVWFGHPLYDADFISEGEILSTRFFPCARYEGTHTARSIQAFLEM